MFIVILSGMSVGNSICLADSYCSWAVAHDAAEKALSSGEYPWAVSFRIVEDWED